jgi:hypothetical protein
MAKSDEEKGRRAIETLTRDIKSWHEKQGHELTETKAHRMAVEIAHRSEKRNKRTDK